MYIPHTQDDVARMLKACRMESVDDLYSDVPAELKMHRNYALPEGMSEQQVADFFRRLARRNAVIDTCFAGAGTYDHYAPALIPALLSRSEFVTAYTPYQPEISQGTLQYIFEYQSMMTQLTGLDISNASMYDATTATAEAVMMTVAAARKRRRVLMSATLNPTTRRVVLTYARYHGVTVDIIPERDGVTDLTALSEMLTQGDPVAGVILPQPNFYGIVEDFTGVAEMIHSAKALMVMHCPAIALATLKTPGEWGADIAVGDAQSLGIPMSYGGPYLGYMCTTKALMRKMPGRIVGATTDNRGQRAFVLTLQAREQHIRRNKATSNICSNQGIMALYVTIYMAMMGAKGLQQANSLGHDGIEYLTAELDRIGIRRTYPKCPVLNEALFDAQAVDIDALMHDAIDRGILPGVAVDGDKLLIATTERQSKQEIDTLVELIKKHLKS